jgi:hypothetical protein
MATYNHIVSNLAKIGNQNTLWFGLTYFCYGVTHR